MCVARASTSQRHRMVRREAATRATCSLTPEAWGATEWEGRHFEEAARLKEQHIPLVSRAARPNVWEKQEV